MPFGAQLVKACFFVVKQTLEHIPFKACARSTSEPLAMHHLTRQQPLPSRLSKRPHQNDTHRHAYAEAQAEARRGLKSPELHTQKR